MLTNAFQKTAPSLSVILSLLLVLQGCAQHISPTGMIEAMPSAALMPVSLTDGAVTVGADPYVEPERLKKVFGRDDLAAKGILPVKLAIEKIGDDRVLVLSRVALELPGGRRIEPVTSFKLVHDYLGLPTSEGYTSARDVAVQLAIGIPTVLIVCGNPFTYFVCLLPDRGGGGSPSYRTSDELGKYRSNEFTSLASSDNVAGGFLYFVLPPETPPFDDAVLVAEIKDSDRTSESIVRLPLTQLGFKNPQGDWPQRELRPWTHPPSR